MKAKVLKPFYDKVEKTIRNEGEVFSATAERLAQINGTAFGKLAEKEEVELPVVETPEAKKKKPTRR